MSKNLGRKEQERISRESFGLSQIPEKEEKEKMDDSPDQDDITQYLADLPERIGNKTRKIKPSVDHAEKTAIKVSTQLQTTQKKRKAVKDNLAEEARLRRFIKNGVIGMEKGEIIESDRAAAFYKDMVDHILSTDDANRFAHSIRMRPARFRTLTFPGQIVSAQSEIEIETVDTPAMVWFRRLTQQLTTYAGLIQQGILSFELIRSILRIIDPTEEQIVEIRQIMAKQRIAAEFASLSKADKIIRTIDLMTERVYEESRDKISESRRFSRIIENYYTSVEAIGRMQTTPGQISCELSARNMKHGRHTATQGFSQEPTTTASKPMTSGPFNPNRMQSSDWMKSILREFDGILDMFGLQHVVYATWSPYGPGPDGLQTVWLIYDDVIEPTSLIARINNDQSGAVITTLDIMTGLVTADAVAEATMVSSSSAAASVVAYPQVRQSFSGRREPTEAASQQESCLLSMPEKSVIEEKTDRWLNIPICDAYSAWISALWTQSHLRHELQIPISEIREHIYAVELRLALKHGTCFHRNPSMLELSGILPVCRRIRNNANDGFNVVSSGAQHVARIISDYIVSDVDTDGAGSRIPSRYGPSGSSGSSGKMDTQTATSRSSSINLDEIRSLADILTSTVTNGASLAAAGGGAMSQISVLPIPAELIGIGLAGASMMELRSQEGPIVMIGPITPGVDIISATIVHDGAVVVEPAEHGSTTTGVGIFRNTKLKPRNKRLTQKQRQHYNGKACKNVKGKGKKSCKYR